MVRIPKISVLIKIGLVWIVLSSFSVFAQDHGKYQDFVPTSDVNYEVSSWQVSKLSKIKYDIAFRKHTRTYIPTLDWRLIKAQCFQESAFNEEAVSTVGAKGLCQFMPRTWEGELERAGLTGHPFNYDLNIQMAAQYMGRLIGQWSSPRPEKDRVSLAFASYNAGLGNILDSQRVCDNENLFTEIMICLPCVTGDHSRETTQYVFRIWSFYSALIETDNY